MNDLTTDLRNLAGSYSNDSAVTELLTRAADEIERMRAERDGLHAQIKGVGIVPYLDRMKEQTAELEIMTESADEKQHEIERLHSWDGLMSLLDEHWPEDIFPTLEDDDKRDSGPRIVSLIRWVERLRAEKADLIQASLDKTAEIERLRAMLAVVRGDDDEIERLREIASAVGDDGLRAENERLRAERDHWQYCFGELWLEWDDTDD